MVMIVVMVIVVIVVIIMIMIVIMVDGYVARVTHVCHVIAEILEFSVDGVALGALIGCPEMNHHVLVAVNALRELLAAQRARKLPDIVV